MMRFTGYMIPLVAVLLLAGAGCNLPFVEPPERDVLLETTSSLLFQKGTTLTLQGTVFGFGSTVLDSVSRETTRRFVTLTSFNSGRSLGLEWKMMVKSTEPDGAGEPVEVTGALATEHLESHNKLHLPAYWREGDEGVIEESGILWLGREQYVELTETGESELRPGIFENLYRFLSFTEGMADTLNRLQGEADRAAEHTDIYKLIAEPGYGTYRLTLDGEKTWVRTVRASNWFGHYTILANPENPLILEVVLNPLSTGAVGTLSNTKVLDALFGYRVIDVTGTDR